MKIFEKYLQWVLNHDSQLARTLGIIPLYFGAIGLILAVFTGIFLLPRPYDLVLVGVVCLGYIFRTAWMLAARRGTLGG